MDYGWRKKDVWFCQVRPFVLVTTPSCDVAGYDIRTEWQLQQDMSRVWLLLRESKEYVMSTYCF